MMSKLNDEMETKKCPRCGSIEFLKKKLILIGKYRNESDRIVIPEFPEINSFHKVIRYPRREEFKEWGYKNVSMQTITDLNWLQTQKEHVLEQAQILLKRAFNIWQ